jgi:hypothetical protein
MTQSRPGLSLSHRSLFRSGGALLWIAATFSVVSLADTAAAQGETGFLRGKGKVDAIAYYNFDTYDEFWLGSNSIDNDDAGFGDIDRISYGLYTAVGITDDVDLTANVPYVIARADSVFPREADFQDLTVRGKWRVWGTSGGGNEFSLLPSPGIKIPLSNYEDNAVTAIGDGQTDYQFRAILHYHHDSGAFASVDTGYDVRAGRPRDEFPLHVTVGMTFGPVTIAPFYTHVDSLGGPDIGDPGFTFPEVEEDYDRVGVGAYVRFADSLGLTANLRTTVDGRNTGDVDAVSVGLVGRF